MLPTLLFSLHYSIQLIYPFQSVKQNCPSSTTLLCFYETRVLGRLWDGLRKESLMMYRTNGQRILLRHICILQDTVLLRLQAWSPTITRIQQQVLPTAATQTPQSVLMAWRVAVIRTMELIVYVIVFVVRVRWRDDCGLTSLFVMQTEFGSSQSLHNGRIMIMSD